MNARPLLRILVWIYCLSWAFDYRAARDAGNSPLQYLFLALTLVSAGAVLVIGFRKLFALPVAWILLGWGLYLFSTGAVMIVNHVAPEWYFRNVLPVLLLLTSLCVVQVAASAGLSWRDVLWPMLIAGTVNVAWRIFYALVMAGIPIETVRVELLSPCLPFLMAFLFCGLGLARTTPWLALLVGAIGTLSYVLSVTRSAVLILGAAGLATLFSLWLAGQMGLLSPGFGRAKLRHMGMVAVLGVAAALVTVTALPVVLERWSERLFHTYGAESSSADPSALTRYAETRAFQDLLQKEPLTWIYGKGLGAAYYWDESYAVELARYTYGDEDRFRNDTMEVRFPGHSIWTYAIFSGGLFGGFCYLGLFGAALVLSLHSTTRLRWAAGYPLEIAYLPFVALMAFLSQSLTFNPFIERAGGLVLGVVIGLPQFLYAAACGARTRPPAFSGMDPASTPS